MSDAEPRDWWLTFESVREKRRLSPAPAGWQALPDDELDAIRVTGEVVPKRRLVE